jgi:prepilin-type N-terminal cleavage/methylation domain-containing protein
MYKRDTQAKFKKGFSLIELSIVLVIIGLLVVTVVAGKSLLNQAKLNSIVSDYTRIQANYKTFALTYGSIPGDFSEAYDFWGADCDTVQSKCDGDGDGKIEYSTGTDDVESFRAWQHLALAELANFSGTGEATASGIAVIGENTPLSKYGAGGYSFYYDTDDHDGETIAENTMQFGAAVSGTPTDNNSLTREQVISPRDAYLLDKKIDDTLAKAGILWGINGWNGVDGFSDCRNSTTLEYDKSLETKLCVLAFVFD